MVSDQCGSSLLVALPEDALTVVNQFLSPKDICNLGSCCRTLLGLASSDEIWIAQCQKIGILLHKDLVGWRKGFASYKALFRFLASVQPLIGIWVHQNPDLGNVVYVMPSFLSVVGRRIIPGPLAMEGSPIQWAPVFEIIGDFDGSASFFLHGREGDDDYLCPGLFKAFDRTCNVLFLKVEARRLSNVVKLVRSQSFDHHIGSGISRSSRLVGKNPPSVNFSELAFDDRRKLMQTVTCQIRLRLPYSTSGLLFPRDGENFQQDIVFLSERRSLLMNLYKEQGGYKKYLSSGFCNSLDDDDGQAQCAKRKGVFGRLKQLVGRSSSRGGDKEHADFHKFLRSADAIGLTLRAFKVNFSYCRGWPAYIYESHFILCKLQVQAPKVGKEYAGLWGGTYGWPPGRPGEALLLVSLSYGESEGKKLLIANKILEGTRYAGHPNGSAMFTVNTDEDVSGHPFPWDADVLHSFSGEGIADGYGFRYPGSKPGSIFVIEGGLLAFVWKQSEAVMTLKRLDLLALLKKGEQVPALSPVLNFTYLSRTSKNVYSNTST